MYTVARCLPLLTILALLLAPSVRAVADDIGGPPKVDISPLETRVFGQTTWIAGSRASLRVIVTNHLTGDAAPASVRLSLVPLENDKPSRAHQLLSSNTDSHGTMEARFTVPRMTAGTYQLAVDVNSRIGKDRIEQNVDLHEAQQVLLTADKPVYQPGQIIHLRSLAMDLANRRPANGQPVTFEVEDARGNKVFKRHEVLSKYGIAGTDFQLADEVNMGTFTLRAILPNGQAEKKVRVERYVLPKFKATVTTDSPYYLPSATAHGTVKAAYFFGKPVAHGKVHIDINTVDIGVTKLTEIDGETDANGVYTFDYQLPASFVGQPLDQGKGTVEFDTHVTDSAGHSEHSDKDVPVVSQPVDIAIVPESGHLVPGVENRVYIAAATPDGTPLKGADLDVKAVESPLTDMSSRVGSSSMHLETNTLGVATFTFTPSNSGYAIHVDALDAKGQRATATRQIDAVTGADGVLLRTDETFAKVGDQVSLTALSTVKHGTIYFDVIRDGQTILTRAEESRNGTANISLPISEDMAGTLQVHAYAILPNENIVRDTRTIIVSPADDLAVKIDVNHTTYRPGENAVLTFDITDRAGHATPAAIGLAIVDESVFALSELQPGLEKVYFALERELMEPRYEIHGLTPSRLYEQSGDPMAARQTAGAMLLAAAQPDDPFAMKLDTYQQRWDKVKGAVLTYMTKERQRIADAVNTYNGHHDVPLRGYDSLWTLVDDSYLRVADLMDPWGHVYRTDIDGDKQYSYWFTLKSAGPDGKWDTVDDVVVNQPRAVFRGMMMGGGGFPGGGGGFANVNGAVEDEMAAPVNAPVLATLPTSGTVFANRDTGVDTKSASVDTGSAAPRVRSYFPETLFWSPSIITDDAGHAILNLPMADSITTWRISAMADSMDGALGSNTAPIKVFQDFFADIDLPVALTQGDSVDIPVALYNYLPTAQDVDVALDQQPWFTLQGEANRKVHLDANQVSVIYFAITAKSIGKFTLKVTAKGTKLSDAIQREIEIQPNGKRVDDAVNDRLDGDQNKTITIPASAIAGASKMWIKLYPGAFSQVVEGLDGILRMPGGCFEQTSSSTYPDILVLSYLKQNKKINPELQMKAEQYINVGYQRLVTFECKLGGFSWFGDEPAHQVLTAYGLLEFSDMSKVQDVDPALIPRVQAWLAGKQKDDGSWLETNQGIQEGIINRQTDSLRTTAYIGWALAESGYNGPALQNGVRYVKAHLAEAKDPYTLAVLLNLFSEKNSAQFGVNASDAQGVAEKLIALAKTDAKTAYWVSNTQTFTGAVAEGADLETTGLAAYGLLKYGKSGSFVDKVLTYLVKSKDSFGTWESTQGTVWALKSLLYAGGNSVGGNTGTVDVSVNGKVLQQISVTADDNDVMRQIDATGLLQTGDNAVKLAFHGQGSVLYQIATRYYEPWAKEGVVDGRPGILDLHVDYDKTTLAQDATATATVTLHNNTADTVEMPLIDIGVPPGFEVVPDGLEASKTKGDISKYTIAARQIILYLEHLGPNATVKVTYTVRAKYPINALTPASKAYPYYNPSRTVTASPQHIVVTKS